MKVDFAEQNISVSKNEENKSVANTHCNCSIR